MARLLLLTALAGCYGPSFDRCALRCGGAGECPSGTRCDRGGFCVEVGGSACEPADDGAPGGVDAGSADAAPGGRDASLLPDGPGAPDTASASIHVWCGEGLACTESAPFCCYHSTDVPAYRCVADPAFCLGGTTYQCDDPGDCGALGNCCQALPGTSCQPSPCPPPCSPDTVDNCPAGSTCNCADPAGYGYCSFTTAC